jgi:hypothetical protein
MKWNATFIYFKSKTVARTAAHVFGPPSRSAVRPVYLSVAAEKLSSRCQTERRVPFLNIGNKVSKLRPAAPVKIESIRKWNVVTS